MENNLIVHVIGNSVLKTVFNIEGDTNTLNMLKRVVDGAPIVAKALSDNTDLSICLTTSVGADEPGIFVKKYIEDNKVDFSQVFTNVQWDTSQALLGSLDSSDLPTCYRWGACSYFKDFSPIPAFWNHITYLNGLRYITPEIISNYRIRRTIISADLCPHSFLEDPEDYFTRFLPELNFIFFTDEDLALIPGLSSWTVEDLCNFMGGLVRQFAVLYLPQLTIISDGTGIVQFSNKNENNAPYDCGSKSIFSAAFIEYCANCFIADIDFDIKKAIALAHKRTSKYQSEIDRFF